MVSGVNLTLMIGPAVPLPVPRIVMDALVSVQVTSASGETPSGFELKFSVDSRSALQTLLLLAGGALPPILRCIIIATFNGLPNVLMDGVILDNQITPGSNGAASTLTLRGKDLSAVMDVIDFTGLPYPAMPVFARVLLILAKYSVLGMIPLVIPPLVTDLPIPTALIPRHQGKDLGYLRRLAREAGYVFYVDPGPLPGTSTAYWGPEIKIGVPQPALNIDMDAHTNVEALSFRFDKESKKMPVIYILEENTGFPIPIPIPDVSPLNPPLGLIPPLPPKLEPLEETVRMNPLQAVMFGLAEASRSSDCVFGTGSLDVLRYGRILKPRGLVGVRGAGVSFDGLYFVSSVTHKIKRGEYKQDFELKRNGLVSTVPRVPA
ncbi:MAG: hypothetical protein ABI806_05885 [Candidatus Solibacter sp.]